MWVWGGGPMKLSFIKVALLVCDPPVEKLWFQAFLLFLATLAS